MMDLSDAYENAAHIPEGAAIAARWPEVAAAYRAQLGARFVPGFDPETRSGSDLVRPTGMPQGMMIFIHGGYWMRFSPRDWTHLAQGAEARGWAVAFPGYPLAPNVHVSDITRAVAREITKLAESVAGPFVLTGHSAGGHLAARMCALGVLPPEVLARIRCVAPISMLSNLSPLLRTDFNKTLQLSPEEVAQESPVTQPRPDVPVQLWVGADERPVFLDQTRWLAEAWNVPSWVLPDRHHFDVIDDLQAPNSAMLSWLLSED